MILGIDEAGRGPAIGPLVLCGVRCTASQLPMLAALKLQDSKAYGSDGGARTLRADLARRICRLVRVDIEVVEADEIDRWVDQGGLNRLEQHLAARIIERGSMATRIIADGRRLFAPLTERYAQLEAVDRAERVHPTVAAASIVAKAERDRRMDQLFEPYQAEYGPIRGGGYPNAATARFLHEYVAQHSAFPAGVRRSWSWKVLQELSARCGALTMRVGCPDIG